MRGLSVPSGTSDSLEPDARAGVSVDSHDASDASPTSSDTGSWRSRMDTACNPDAPRAVIVAISGCIGRAMLLPRRMRLRGDSHVRRCRVMVLGVGRALQHLRRNFLPGVVPAAHVRAIERGHLERPCGLDASVRGDRSRRGLSSPHVQVGVGRSVAGRARIDFGCAANFTAAALPWHRIAAGGSQAWSREWPGCG